MAETASIQVQAARSDTVDSAFARSAARHGQQVALKFTDREWTYQGLDGAITEAARVLQDLGLKPGDRIACYGKNSDAYLIAYFACLRGGFVHVPVNFALTGGELAYILGDCGASLVLADADLAPTVETVLAEVPAESVMLLLGGEESLLDKVTKRVGDSASAPPLEAPLRDADDLAQLLYTSGTTSKPKGAMMTHRALLAEYESCIVALDLSAEDKPLIAMPLYHSAAMHVFAAPYLLMGATIRLLVKPDIAQMLEVVESEGIGSLFLAPTVWVPLAGHPDLATRDLSSLTKAQYGASIMPVTVLQRLRQQYPDIGFYNCFGQSEIGPLACVLRPEEHDERPASCGRPVFNVSARVMTAAGEPAAVGEPGEIQYRSPQLCLGYWNQPELTAEAFADGWFHSGDQVVTDDAGYVEVVDRIKDVINTGGIMVASREIEDAIYQHDAVAEVAVIGAPDDRWIEAVTAYVVTKTGASVTASEIVAHTKERLAPFKVPKAVEFVDELPRNQSGKILKRELRQR